MSEPVKIAIIVEGGVIQNVLTAGVPVKYVIVDYDTDDTAEADIANVPQYEGDEPSGRTAKAFISSDHAESHGPFVMAAFDLI